MFAKKNKLKTKVKYPNNRSDVVDNNLIILFHGVMEIENLMNSLKHIG